MTIADTVRATHLERPATCSRIRRRSMLEIIVVIAVVLALAIAVVLILAATKPDKFSVERDHQRQCAAGSDLSADRRFPSMGSVVALRKPRPRDEARATAARPAARARSTPGTATTRSAPAGWKFSKSSAPAKIVIKLDFFKPFEGHNTAEFTMLPQGEATVVTWLMHGPAPFMSQADAGVHEHGQYDRQGFCKRPRQSETARREMIDQPKRQKRSKR